MTMTMIGSAALTSNAFACDASSLLQACSYAPVVDGVELTTHPWIALASGDVADVPVLHGTNTDEGALFAVLSHQASEEELHAYWAAEGYSEEEVARLDQLYVQGVTYPATARNNSVYWWAGQRALGDSIMSCPAQYASQQLSALQASGIRQSSTFMYHFEHLPRRQSLTRHVAELEFVFHQKELLASERDLQMADLVASLWGNFFVKRDPNSAEEEEEGGGVWTPYVASDDNLLVLREADDAQMAGGIKTEECAFFIPRLDASIRSKFE